MKKIQLTGKERSVVRSLDFSLGCTGEELLERTKLEPDVLHDILSALMDAGYVETTPFRETIPFEEMASTTYEVNPGYAHGLKEAIGKSY